MKASELTIEFVRGLYEKAGMTPTSFQFCMNDCGCLVGAMAIAGGLSKSPSNLWGDYFSKAEAVYGLGVNECDSIIEGFDNGWDDGRRGERRYNIEEDMDEILNEDWVLAAYNIGYTLGGE